MTAHAQAEARLSDTVAGLARVGAGDRVRLADIMAALGGRAFAILMLIFSLPNAIGLGTIPGLSTIFGVPQLFLAVQMVLGFRQPWLPLWLLEKSIPRSDIAKISERAEPYLVKFERFLRQRWLFM